MACFELYALVETSTPVAAEYRFAAAGEVRIYVRARIV